ncbi:hypothetical protein SHEEN_61 [Mycobacterium phage Sheen]|uniref:Uncharacterized protein n=1 Tax=Mycobacterium phage Sheen TaxID=1589274 RepID=A0A0B5A3N1_9CAUD|nr:hypothetical protein AVV31_gp33 [Mycobacterium phage Sheen]AJD82479.1 hypothetical protein SHEEN_61 [Mycobacterium phage Sheen]
MTIEQLVAWSVCAWGVCTYLSLVIDR